MVSQNDMEPTKFDSMRKAAKSTGVGEGVIRHPRNNGRDFVRKIEDEKVKVFLIKWCSFDTVKMPHNKLKVRPIWLNSAGMIKCRLHPSQRT